MTDHRDIDLSESAPTGGAGGRKVIAVIGIDRYESWPALSNAVNDAREARRVFQSLGFEELTAPLLDGDATREAIHSLVTDDLRHNLRQEDSLVLFYAGHGGNRKDPFDEKTIRTGFLIPTDAKNDADKVATWIEVESWLKKVSLLPPKHILVILDACFSGIALGSNIERYRGEGDAEPLASLSQRRSRRIITSALPEERALDSGPKVGNSLFTGYLIEGLEGGLARDGLREATGSRIGSYVQRRVCEHTASKQTPDFGAFALDGRGEMVIPLLSGPSRASAARSAHAPTRRAGPRGSHPIGASRLFVAIAMFVTLLVGGIGALMAIGGRSNRDQAQLPTDKKTEESAGADWHELMSSPPSADGGPVSSAQNESAPESGRVDVVVRSEPTGAIAKLVRPSQSGPTPKTFTRLLTNQRYRVTIEKPGFLAAEISIKPEQGNPPVVKLKRKPAFLHVTSDPPGATVWLTHWRRWRMKTPADVPLSVEVQEARRVRVLLEKEGYLPEEREVVLNRLVEKPEALVQEEVVGLHPTSSSTSARAER